MMKTMTGYQAILRGRFKPERKGILPGALLEKMGQERVKNSKRDLINMYGSQAIEVLPKKKGGGNDNNSK